MTESRSKHPREALERVQGRPLTVLAIDTSTSACSIAVSVRGCVHEDHRIVPREHNRLVLPMIDDLLRTHGVVRRDLDAVAFGRGPGSFTGVRIAASVAQGISFGLGVPVVPISSLAALARAAATTHAATAACVLATIRSRPDEIYLGGFRCIDARCDVVIDETIAAGDATELPKAVDSSWWIVGDGVSHFGAALDGIGCRVDATALPSAAAVLTLALDAIGRGAFVASADALPVYLQGTRPWRKLAD